MSYQQMNIISESCGYPVSGLAAAALLQGSDGHPHGRQWLYGLLQHFVAGRSRLPVGMGLEERLFYRLCAEAGIEPLFSEAEEEHQLLLQTLILQRQAECQELEAWLRGYVRPEVREMATIIAHGCMGFRHLWEDLGLESRQLLRSLMTECFPELAAMNQQDMRWKKFFYRQRCEQEGGYLCRAPSCHACHERANCFAAE